MATHSSILVWEIPRTEEPGGLQPVGLQKSWTQLSNETVAGTKFHWGSSRGRAQCPGAPGRARWGWGGVHPTDRGGRLGPTVSTRGHRGMGSGETDSPVWGRWADGWAVLSPERSAQGQSPQSRSLQTNGCACDQESCEGPASRGEGSFLLRNLYLIYSLIHSFSAAVDLHRCPQDSLVASRGFLFAMASLVAEHGL